MKKIITLGISLFLALITFGQRLDYDNTSRWFFGLNAGAAWNTTDVKNDTKGGWGFIIGKQYNANYGTAFSYDLRLRYLGGRWNGQDFDTTNLGHLGPDYNGALLPYKDSLGFTVNNFDARAHELGLEFAIHLNRFTDRTGWDPYIFGGANVVWNQTKGNLFNEFNQPPSIYNYDSTGFSPSNVNAFQDNNYESILDGSSNTFDVDFMPSLGIGLGYQVGPRFSIGVEHKTTFTLADNFDGYQDATPQWGIFENDIYHYTSAYLRFGFRTRASRPVQPPRPVDPVVNNPVQPTDPVQCQDPVIGLVRPNQHTVTVTEGFYVFSANVNYVANRSDITLEVNGIPTTNFLYNPQTRQVETNIQLNAGSNNVKITARNACGSDSEFVTIVYDDCNEPIVRFESTCANGASVSSAAYAVRANVQNAANVVFTLNGAQISNFSYNQTTGAFSSNVTLRRGQNTIQITVTNECGTDTQTISVNYTECADAYVNFFAGNGAIVQSQDANYTVQAYVVNVTSKNQIVFKVNGVTRSFNFNTANGLLESTVGLNAGQNTIQIVATNNCGTDTEIISVDYTPCVDPTIQVLLPAAMSSTAQSGTQLIRAKVTNVATANSIQVFVNGTVQSGGVFNAGTKVYEKTVALQQGINTIKIVATNQCGAITQTITVNYNPCDNPNVQLIMPSANGGLTQNPAQVVQAMVFNTTGMNQIQLYLNGTLQSGGVYNAANGLYQNTVTLAAGMNTIQVVATNNCGSDIKTATIEYRRCNVPTITMISPTANPFYTDLPGVNISAVVTGVTGENQITTLVNGITADGGEGYNNSTNTYTNLLDLAVGNNVVKITATNDCGTVTKEINIIREEEDPIVVDEMITICYIRPNNVGDPQTIQIPASQWPAYQAQGATLGPCPVPVDEEIIICMEIGGVATQMTILESQWPTYQAQGAILGACPEITKTICLDGTTLQIPESQWPAYQAQGATEGTCPDVPATMIICKKGVQLEILVSEWPAYQVQGAVQGPCPPPTMVICFNNQTQTILVSEWPTYQAQGAVQGTCRAESMQICLNGNTLTIPVAQWATYQSQGAVQGPCSSKTIVICYNGETMEIPESKWPTMQQLGATLGACPDIPATMIICKNGVRLEISVSEWPAYQLQGATKGECPDEPETMIICKKGVQLEILVSEWPAYQVQGAVQGPCPAPTMVICFNNQTQTILVSEWPAYQAQGAVQGTCRAESMQICFNGNTLTIPAAQWSIYQAQGAVQGPCSNKMVVICYNGETMEIPESKWLSYQAQGATQGPCKEKTMIICLNGETMEIPESKWPEMKRLGATEGPCPTETMIICFNGETMEIPVEQWEVYKGEGAKEGRCDEGGIDTNPVEMITICYHPEGSQDLIQAEIPLSSWPAYQAGGAIQGPCPNVTVNPDTISSGGKITICHIPPGNPGNPQEIEIPLSAWPAHQAHGDVLGPCQNGTLDTDTTSNQGTFGDPTNPGRPGSGGRGEGMFDAQKITICYTPEGERIPRTMQVPLNEWDEYRDKGASLGPCTTIPSNGGNNQGQPGQIISNPNGNQGGIDPNGSDGQKNLDVNDDARKAQEAAKQKAEAERQAKEAANQKAKLEAERKAAEDAKKAQEAAKQKAEAERQAKEVANQKAKLEAERKAAEDAKKAQEAAKQKAEAERQAKEAANQKAKLEAERKAAEDARKAQEAAKQKAEAERQAKEAANQKAKLEAERKAAEDAKKAQEAAKQKAEAERQAKEVANQKAKLEAERKAAEDFKKAQEAAKQKAIEDAKKAKEEVEKKAEEELKGKEVEEGGGGRERGTSEPEKGGGK